MSDNERQVLERVFPLTAAEGDGRTLDVIIVPYGEPAEVSDDGGRTFYREQWDEGAFDAQLAAGHRLKVLMNFEHNQGISNVIGKGVSLRSEPDGLHGSFRLLETQDGDKALDLVREEILDGISLEAYSLRAVRSAAGVVRRVSARLVNVALCRTPAFAGARVLAVREQDEQNVMWDEELLPHVMDSGLVERLRAQGIKLPDRYKTQPAETDTPSTEGTSEAAPVENANTNSMED